MAQFTGIFKVVPYKDISSEDSLENSVVQAFGQFLFSGKDHRIWKDQKTCATEDPPQGFLNGLKEQHHYHFIVRFDTQKAMEEAWDDIDWDPNEKSSLSVEPVRNTESLINWIEIGDLEEIEIPDEEIRISIPEESIWDMPMPD